MTHSKLTPISRRNFIKLSGVATAGIALSACGISQTPTLTLANTSTPIPTGTPGPTTTPHLTEPVIPLAFKGLSLSVQYLEENGKLLQASLQADSKGGGLGLIQTPSYSSKPSSELSPLDFALKAFRIGSFNYDDPLQVLKFVIGQGPRLGSDQAVTFFQPNGKQLAFSELAIYRGRLENPDRAEYQIAEGYPQKLTLRNEAGITVVGIWDNRDIVIAFEENLLREETDSFSPYMRFAIVSSREFVSISKNLPNTYYSIEDPTQIVYFDSLSQIQRTVEINPITEGLIGLIYEEAGFFWIDKYPVDSGSGFMFFPRPVVKYSKDIGIPSGVRAVEKTNLARKGHVRSKVIQVVNQQTTDELRWIIDYVAYTKTWVWKTPKWRHIGELIGIDVSDVTIGDNPYDDPSFQKALADNFSMLMPGGFIEFTTWGKDLPRADRASTRRNDQVLHIFPLFWQSSFLDYSLKNASIEDIKVWMENRVDEIFEFIQPINLGERPTYLTIANELAIWVDPKTGEESAPGNPWLNPKTGKTEWGANPFHRAYGSNALKEMYLMVYRKALEKGIQIGKDLYLAYVDFNNHTTRFGSKTKALLRILKKTKEDVANELGVEPSQVQLNVGIQGHFFYKNRPEYLLPPPTEDELEAAIILFKEIGDVFMTEVNIIGASDQQDKVEKYLAVFRVALKTKCISVGFWDGLRSSVPPGNRNDIYYSSPANFFDAKFQPVTGNGYDDILNLLLNEARNGNLIG